MLLKDQNELMRFSVKNLRTFLHLASIQVNVEDDVLDKYLSDFEAGNKKNINVFEEEMKTLLGKLGLLEDFAKNFYFEKFETLEDYLLISAEHYIFRLLGHASDGSKNKLYELFRYINVELIERIRDEKRSLKQEQPTFQFWTIIMSSSREGNITALNELTEKKELMEQLLVNIFKVKEVRGQISPSEFHNLSDKIRQFLVLIFHEFEKLYEIDLDEEIRAEQMNFQGNIEMEKLYGFLHSNFKYKRALEEGKIEEIKKQLIHDEKLVSEETFDYSSLFKEILAKNIDDNFYYENTDEIKNIIHDIQQSTENLTNNNAKVQDIAKRSGRAISLLVSMVKRGDESEMDALAKAVFKCVNQSKEYKVDSILSERIKYTMWSLKKVPKLSSELKQKCEALLKYT